MSERDVPEGFELMPPFGPFHELVGPIYWRRTEAGFTIGLRAVEKHRNKGDMVRQLARLLGKDPRHVYCVGDHANDMSMLRFSHIPFAPANALDCVKAIPGTHVLPDSRQDAIAALIGVLDRLYEGV